MVIIRTSATDVSIHAVSPEFGVHFSRILPQHRGGCSSRSAAPDIASQTSAIPTNAIRQVKSLLRVNFPESIVVLLVPSCLRVVLSFAFSVHSFGLLHASMQRRATAAPHRCEPSRCRSLLCVVCELSRRPTAGLSHRDHRARRHDGRSSRTDLGLAATSLMADLPSPGSFPRVLPRRGNVSDDSQIQFLAMISQDSCHTARATKGLIWREFGHIRSGKGPMLLIS